VLLCAISQVLWLHNCNLTGGLPASWSTNLPALSVLDLAENELTGARIVACAYASQQSRAQHLQRRTLRVGKGAEIVRPHWR
jgi:hypothetical protein